MRRALVLCALGCALWGSAGCAPQASPETESFERAEVAYRRGEYKRALGDYEVFLKTYPSSPLARVARQRIRCLNREVQALLGRHGMPRPIYLPPPQNTTADGAPAPDARVSPPAGP